MLSSDNVGGTGGKSAFNANMLHRLPRHSIDQHQSRGTRIHCDSLHYTTQIKLSRNNKHDRSYRSACCFDQACRTRTGNLAVHGRPSGTLPIGPPSPGQNDIYRAEPIRLAVGRLQIWDHHRLKGNRSGRRWGGRSGGNASNPFRRGRSRKSLHFSVRAHPAVNLKRSVLQVWFCANSGKTDTGAFQEYSLHDQAELGHTPDNVSDLQAATLGTGLITAGVALFRTFKFDLHDLLKEAEPISKSERPWILIWGGAGITGIYLIQLARLLGFRIICAASPVNHEYVRSLGAEVVLDRWTEPRELMEQIRVATEDNVNERTRQTVGKHFTDRDYTFSR
jgi:hypothetical protein